MILHSIAGVYGILTSITVPEWVAGLTLGEIIGWAIAATAIVVAILPAVRAIIRSLRAILRFLQDWNGTEDRRDRSGRLIESGQPGIPALLETVRSQVQNSHSTNLRDDLDSISRKLDEHIAISKHHDRTQSHTAEQLQEHLDQTEEWRAMLEDLHARWADRKQRQPPDQPSED